MIIFDLPSPARVAKINTTDGSIHSSAEIFPTINSNSYRLTMSGDGSQVLYTYWDTSQTMNVKI
jgi:hypothetical protein